MMFPWAVGYSVLPVITYYVRDWYNLQLLASAPLPFFLIAYFFLPECPRWLLTKGRFDEANAIMEKAARINGKNFEAVNNLTEAAEKETEAENVLQKQATLIDLFRTPNLRRNSLISMFNWFTVVFVYYGLTLSADTLIPGDMYLNTAVAGLIEIPAYLFCLIVVHFMGRRMPLAIMFIIGGTLLFVTAFMEKGVGMMVVVMAGKFGIICIFAIIYLHSSEVFPTVVRTSGLGTCSMCGRIGSMLAPIIGRELGQVNRPAAIVIFAVLSIKAGVLTLWLPETRGKKLADTIEEGESNQL